MFNLNFIYCEIIINCGVLIFADFVVHLNHENQNNFPIGCCLYSVVLKTTNSRSHGSMHFLETMKIGTKCTVKSTFHSTLYTITHTYIIVFYKFGLI
jgi:hypothetical protein